MNKNISKKASIKWLDNYTKVLLAVMIVILMFIFGAGKYMDSHKMAAGGTDDKVNNMAQTVTKREHHPFIELPGDAEVGAFSVANFFAGLIIGHYFEQLFGDSKARNKKELQN
ncbi:MAG: hypothetical protein PHX70_12500 [Clostridium sp.]|nr:hypothetical protein [Clostridium sp.]